MDCNDAVTAAKLATDAVETLKIKDAAVTTDKIANGAVTVAKITGIGSANGIASLDGAGKVPVAQLPNSVMT
jgi:hypothetical protein